MPVLPIPVAGGSGHVQHSGALAALYNVLANLPRVSVRRNTSQSILNSTFTAVSFDTEEKDVGGMWTPGQPTRLVIPVAGDYLFTGVVQWDSNASGNRTLGFRVNGATSYRGPRIEVSNANFDSLNGSVFIPNLAINDFVELVVSQVSGVPLNILTGEQSPRFSAFLVSTTF